MPQVDSQFIVAALLWLAVFGMVLFYGRPIKKRWRGKANPTVKSNAVYGRTYKRPPFDIWG